MLRDVVRPMCCHTDTAACFPNHASGRDEAEVFRLRAEEHRGRALYLEFAHQLLVGSHAHGFGIAGRSALRDANGLAS